MFNKTQLQVIFLMKKGLTIKQIADELNYCERMIARYINEISNILNIPNLPTRKRRKALIERIT